MKKQSFIYFFFLFFLLSFMACGGDSNESVKHDPNKPITLTSFEPGSGRVAEKVLINGENFGTNTEDIKVFFNSKQAAVIQSNGERIYAICPRMPGDTCTISVVVGKDSATYEKKFKYNTSVSVSTIVGNGETTLNATGALSEATFQPSYLSVDEEYNIFACVREKTPRAIIRVNEEKNEVMTLISDDTGKLILPNALCVNPETGIIYIPSETSITSFFTCDPNEMWAARSRNFTWRNLNGFGLPTNSWKHSMGFCKLDGYIYTRFFEGQIVKIDPITYEADIVAMTPNGTAIGVTFHPLKPELLYIAGRSGGVSNGLYSLDVREPKNTLRRLNATGGGYRDGDLSKALFNAPWQIFFDPDGNLYVADANNHCIRKVSSDNKVETVVGMPGTKGWKDGGKEDALFNEPRGVAVDKEGTVYIADYGNSRIRKLAIQ